MDLFVYGHSDYFAYYHLEWVKWVDHFEYVRMWISVWMETFEIVRFEIKIMFCKIKKDWNKFLL